MWYSDYENIILQIIELGRCSPTFRHIARTRRDHSHLTSRSIINDKCASGSSIPPQISLSLTLARSEKMNDDGNGASKNGPCRTVVFHNHSPSPPILSHVGDCSPPGTLNKVPYEENISCRNWCSRYSQVCSDPFIFVQNIDAEFL